MREALGKNVREPVAVVGIGCRLPGARGPGELWRLLSNGVDAIGEVPADRFGSAGPAGGATSAGGFLSGVDQFDADFFGISGHEAARLDPQHRLMLQTAWESFEDAGMTADGLAGSRTGVYTACLNADYWDVVRDAGLTDMHAVAGNGAWGMPAGRLSHLFDLRGPSLGVEATCATSLLAVHLACRDLWSGQADAALVAGANLLLANDFYLALAEAGILSADGRARFGDAASDGYVRSEGAVAVVLKPLTTAQRDGDRVYATILGGAVNNNGRGSDTLITPSVDGQVAMLRAAYADAGVSPDDVDYVEAHGAGTPVGDDVELTALHDVFAAADRSRPCLVGSVKSNIGHIEAAAGLAGLAKTALALHHGRIPPTLRITTPHPLLARENSPLAAVTAPARWPGTGRAALAGISSFGLSATNVHLVLAAVRETPDPAFAPVREACLLPVSAHTEGAARELASAYATLVGQAGDDRLPGVLFSAAVRRSHHQHRIAVTGRNAAELAAGLRAAADGTHSERVATGRTRPARVVFVYSGQGSQWKGMCQDLYEVEPTFRRVLLECAEVIRAEAGWWLPDRFDSLDGPGQLQPALWATQVALAATWRAWGIEPDVVIGHSMGEIAAACTSGALTLRDGGAIAVRRGELIGRLPGQGAMAAVGIGAEQAHQAIGHHADRVAVAAVNSANSVVLAGEPAALEAVLTPLREAGVFCAHVNVEYASHSPHVAPVRDELAGLLADVRPQRTAIRLRSTVSCDVVDGEELDGGYWADNLCDPVRFGPALVRELAESGPVTFVEISPHPVLAPVLADLLAETGIDGVAVASALRGEAALGVMLAGLGVAYTRGHSVSWEQVQPAAAHADLPLYPWQGRRHWVRPWRSAAAELSGEVRTYDPHVTAPERDELVRVATELATAAAEQALGAGWRLSQPQVHGTAAPGSPLRVVLLPAGDDWSFAVRAEEPGASGVSRWIPVLSGHLMVDSADEPDIPAPRAVGDWFVDAVRSLLDHDHVDLNRPLPELGMDSVLATKLLARARTELGVRLPTKTLLGANTLRSVISELERGADLT